MFHGVIGEGRVVLFAREPLLLRGGDDLPVAHQARRAVMMKGGQSKDVHRTPRPLGFKVYAEQF